MSRELTQFEREMIEAPSRQVRRALDRAYAKVSASLAAGRKRPEVKYRPAPSGRSDYMPHDGGGRFHIDRQVALLRRSARR